MMPEAKDPRLTIAAQRPDNLPERSGLRLVHALLLAALGGWLLVRALQTVSPDARMVTIPAYAGGSAGGWAAGALLLGSGMLIAAMALPNGRAWAWVGASAVALAALMLLSTAWLLGAGGDWFGVLLSLGSVVVLAAPSARELYLR